MLTTPKITSHRTLALGAALALATAAAPLAGSAFAATGPAKTDATPASVKIQKAYAFRDTIKEVRGSGGARDTPIVVVVFKTAGQLPRRYDGLIRAGGQLGSGGGSSIGSVAGRASRCYTFDVNLRDGRFRGSTSDATGPKASVGTRRVVTISARDKNADPISSTKTVTLRDRLPGDRSGKSIGC